MFFFMLGHAFVYSNVLPLNVLYKSEALLQMNKVYANH